MKLTRHSRAAALLLAAALAACSDEGPTASAPEAGLSLLERQVAALGFRSDMIEDHGEFVLVEGDIYLSKAQLRTVNLQDAGDPLRPSFQYRTSNLVGSPKVQEIRVDVSGLASQPDWQTAARAALTHWSGIANSYVRLVEAAPADITVSTTCTSYNVAAYASFPSGGNPGSTIFVNTCFGYSTSYSQKLHNMVHEFGHTLGFRHSNYTQMGESAGVEGAVHISGTPTSGNAGGSVMNGGTALNSWAGFSSHDRTATARLYPLPAPAVTATDVGGYVVLNWAPLPGASYYQVQRAEERYYNNHYESRYYTYPYRSGFWNVYGNSYETGAPFTGVSECYWYNTGYEEEYTYYWYEVKAVFANGSSAYVASVGTNDASC